MDTDGVSLGSPSSLLRGFDLSPCPSASVLIPSGQGSALEVAKSLLDLGCPPEAGFSCDALGSLLRPTPAGAGLPRSSSGTRDVLPGVLRCAEP